MSVTSGQRLANYKPRSRYRTVILVRHGEFTRSTLGLTPRGRRQASLAGRRLRRLTVGAVHCSTMRRAHETALIIVEQISGRPPVRAHLLRECLPTVPPDRRREMPQVTDEMIRRGKARVDRAYSRYFRPPTGRDRCEVLVSHGNVIRYLVGLVLGLDPFGWYQLGTSHCGITVVRIEDTGRVILDVYNDTGHLPHGMRTTGTISDP